MSIRDVLIGIDVGGTFTDAVLIVGGDHHRAKSPSTYPDIGRGVLASCQLASQRAGLEFEALLPRVRKFGLGTTAVTNVIATRTGQRVGLLTTRGFEETLRLARGRTRELDGWLQSADALVAPGAVVGIDERIDHRGDILRPMDESAVIAAGRHLIDDVGVESLAVSFLWSFLNPVHERRALELLRGQFAPVPVTGGCELRPVIREYERTMLAVLNAYSFGAYSGVQELASQLRRAGLTAPILLCHSGGGAISIDEARTRPVWLAASGPAAGVAAAARLAADAAEQRVLTCDLGGTSFDVAHVAHGTPARTQRGDLMGFWTALPRIDVESVGAGGGSLSWVDERSMLRVGPRSAGSSPGPVCYGRGGRQAALTDALLVLGYLDAERFLGGTMRLDRDSALRACERLGRDLGLDAEEAAWGIREIALAEMLKAMRARISSHALSASEHCLVSYGGCGALFAADVARQVGLRRVYVPALASVLSAYGAATMDIRRERLCTLLQRLPAQAGVLERALDEVQTAVSADLAADGVAPSEREVRFEADARFAGQRWELMIALPATPQRGDGGREMESLFRAEYRRRFGKAATTASGVVELVAVRAVGIGHMSGARADVPAARAQSAANDPRTVTPLVRRSVKLSRNEAAQAVDVYDGGALAPGDYFNGPALVDASDTTVWVPPGMCARTDARRSLVIEVVTAAVEAAA